MDSQYNLYTIDENSFKAWVEKTMSQDAKAIIGRYVKDFNRSEVAEGRIHGRTDTNVATDRQIANFLWNNVLTMRQEAQPTSNAHGRGDMP